MGMTYFKARRRALQWRYELLDDTEEGSIFGHVDDRGEDWHVYDLVRVVSVDGVDCVVPTTEDALSVYELGHVRDAAWNIVEDMREAASEDNGYDG